MVERLHPPIDPLASVLPGRIEAFAVQLTRIVAQDLATQPLDRLGLHHPLPDMPTVRLGACFRQGCVPDTLPDACGPSLDVPERRFAAERFSDLRRRCL